MSRKPRAFQRRIVVESPRVNRTVLPVLILLCSITAAAHSAVADPTYRLLSIHFKGLNRYTEDQVVRASGLRKGDMAGDNEFKQAAQKLGETGVFTDVAYTYRYSDAGCDVEFQVEEDQRRLSIVFDNFVWFSDDELLQLLRARIPLFDGTLPQTGNLADRVASTLNTILAERKIAGQVDYLAARAALNGPIDSYLYDVKFHPILIREISFPGAAPAESPALQAAGTQLLGKEYRRAEMPSQEKYGFLPVYFARGYLKAAFAQAQSKIVQDGAETQVDVSFPVTPGIQFKLTGMAWTGNAVFETGQLQKLVHLKSGDPANAVQLGVDLDAVHKLYGTKGYLAAHVSAIPTMDDSAAAVSYELKVREGDLYRMGELQIDGVDAETAKKIASLWQIQKGDPYDDSYLFRFLQRSYRVPGLSGSYNLVQKQSIDQQNKTVTVTLHFVAKK
jgi:outer membrane protein assembly factor BamA